MKVCSGCTKAFSTKRKGQIYHNQECYRKSTLKLSTCPVDKKKFQKRFSSQICCSRKCSYLYRVKKQRKGIYVKCAYCGKDIYRIKSSIKKYNFCSVNHTKAYLKSNKNIDFGKGWHHKPDAIEKIRQASLNRNYDKVLTDESRQKMAESAKNKKWTDQARKKLRLANLGKRLSERTKRKIRINGKYGEDNAIWKGDIASYQAIHMWAARHIGKTRKCVDCGKIGIKYRFQLSNKDHKYFRNIEDWAWRRITCHQKYDLQHRLVQPKGKARNFFAKFYKVNNLAITMDGEIVEPDNFDRYSDKFYQGNYL